MSRYIDANKLIERLMHSPLFLIVPKNSKDGIIDLIVHQPTADVAPIADTVRKMQERLIAEFRKDDRMNYYIRKTLEQIAKEMSNEKTYSN